jgi:hypothetical protein
MRDYDPWVFEMLWQNEEGEELRRLADARLARQAVLRRAKRSSAPGGRRAWSHLVRLRSAYESSVRLPFRRSRHGAEGGA